MDDKERLKLAKEALESGSYDRDTIEYIFPELKESGDEKIRKAIVEFFELQDDNTTYSFIPKKDILAWLEKQKHAITCSEEQMKVLNEVLNFAANHESSYWNDYIFETLNNLIRQLKN